MQEPTHNSAPYKHLGNRLKFVREQKRETLAEAAGAVEIDLEELERIESGKELPPEDILMLLINHFDVQDHEALQLWRAAGYEPSDIRDAGLPEQAEKNFNMIVVALDMRTHYTDNIDIKVTDSGVVMNFGQVGTNGVQPVSRVGMSHQQAADVLRALQSGLLKARYDNGPRLLPPGDQTSS